MAVYEIEGKVFDLPSTLHGEELMSLLQDIQDVMRAFGWNQSPLPDAQTRAHVTRALATTQIKDDSHATPTP
jgi:hypothetical protein